MSNDKPETTAILLERHEIVVVRMDTSSERFGRFASITEATEWAMLHRDRLRLSGSASWYVQEIESV